MRRLLLAALCVTGLAVMLPAVADAVAIAIGPTRPGKNRVAVTDAIVLGRVRGKEDQAKDQIKQEIADATQCAKLMENAKESLQSKDQKDRYLTAALLITQYRTMRTQGAKTEKVSVEESKLILLALAEADWKVQNMPG